MSMRNKKKIRRVAKEIQRDFECPYASCNKQYGSEVSWNLHIKIKHNGGNKTEREKLAKQIIQAQEANQKLPTIDLNFPPGYLDDFRKMYLEETNKQQNEKLSLNKSQNKTNCRK